MKKVLTLLYILAFANVAFAQGVKFEKGSFSDALNKAKKQDKLLFIDAYATWCGPCKKMDMTTFLDKNVGKLMSKDFVALKLDVERGEGPSIKTKYAIVGLPSFLFLDGDGNVVYREEGYKEAAKFIEVLNIAKANNENTADLSDFKDRYANEKNNPAFLRSYLDFMKLTQASGYYELVEQYLSLQKEMEPSSKEMVEFLKDHSSSLIFGGYADQIYQENMGTTAWDKYVRKDVRQMFLNMPRNLAKQTTEFAIQQRDTSYISLSMERSAFYGLPMPEEQRDKLLIYYYKNTNQGELYKQMVQDDIDNFSNSLNIKELHAAQASVEKKLAENPNQRIRSNALIRSEKLRYMVLDYIPFANSDLDTELVLKWSQRVYDVLPNDVNNKVFYAKVQYMFADKQTAIELMNDVIENEKDNKNIEGWKLDLNSMVAGNSVKI